MNATLLSVCLAGMTAGQPDGAVFNAPLIKVIQRSKNGKEYSELLYNRICMGRQYQRYEGQPEPRRLPTTYFHDKGPIGVVLRDPKSFPKEGAPPVMVLGMDIGTLTAYAQPGQTFHLTERVPTFVKLSFPDRGEKRYFTFVQDAIDRGAKVKIFEGEPREMLEKNGGDKFYKLIVVELYKVPVVEVHKELMTKEGLQLLMSKTREDGIVAFHTSNRFYQLPPIVASAANELKLAHRVGDEPSASFDLISDFRFNSEWVMVARDAKYLAHLKIEPKGELIWRPACLTSIVKGKLNEKPIDREFLWTDKGEQSFRGLYRSDPKIDKLYGVVSDISSFLNDTVGVPSRTIYKIMEPVREGFRAWSQSSADALNREPKKSTPPNGDKK